MKLVFIIHVFWSPQEELNFRPRSYQERALPLSYVGNLLLLYKISGAGDRIRTCEA